MRARHRHFNPRDVGALCALDARFLNLSNGTALDSWTDRTRNGNSPTQTSTARPTYNTNQINGSPAVDFDGSNDDLVATVASFDAGLSSTLLIAAKDTAGGRTEIAVSSGDDTLNSNGIAVILRWTDNNAYYQAGDVNKRALWATTVGTTAVIAFVAGGSTQQGFENNVSKGTASSQTGTYNRTKLYVGSGRGVSVNNRYFDGKIGAVAFFNSVLSASVRSRAHHAAAYSFKISCN